LVRFDISTIPTHLNEVGFPTETYVVCAVFAGDVEAGTANMGDGLVFVVVTAGFGDARDLACHLDQAPSFALRFAAVRCDGRLDLRANLDSSL
jgi:hypothetical protein